MTNYATESPEIDQPTSLPNLFVQLPSLSLCYSKKFATAQRFSTGHHQRKLLRKRPFRKAKRTAQLIPQRTKID